MLQISSFLSLHTGSDGRAPVKRRVSVSASGLHHLGGLRHEEGGPEHAGHLLRHRQQGGVHAAVHRLPRLRYVLPDAFQST